MNKKLVLISLFLLVGIMWACVKYKDYPRLTFKTDDGYVFTDKTLPISQPFKVGIIATKNNQSLQDAVVTIVYGNDSLRRTLYTNILTGDSINHYEGEYLFTTSNTIGIEKYTFSVKSIDGIISSNTITIRVE